MGAEQKETRPRHPIGVVSIRTGISQDVLRAWERRYDAVVPHRTETGRRLYSDEDIHRFQSLKEAVEAGRRIGDVAGLPTKDLDELVQEERSFGRGAPPPLPSGDPTGYVESALEAIDGLDPDRLASILSEASLALSAPVLRRELITPIMKITGDRWRAGTFRIANEHLASAVVRSFLGALRTGHQLTDSSPSVVIATLPGQRHEFGALLAAGAAAEVGWRGIYLGSDLPAEEIAAAAAARRARAITLSLSYPATDPAVHEALQTLRRILGPGFPILVGGAAIPSYRGTVSEINATELLDFTEFQAALDAIAGGRTV